MIDKAVEQLPQGNPVGLRCVSALTQLYRGLKTSIRKTKQKKPA